MSPMGSDESREAHEGSPMAEMCRVEWLSFFSSDIARCIVPVGI
jgi:hypothetical protein